MSNTEDDPAANHGCDLVRRLSSMTCLCELTRKSIREGMQGTTTDEHDRYTTESLDFIDRHIANLPDAHFQQLCASLNGQDDVDVIRNKLGLPSDLQLLNEDLSAIGMDGFGEQWGLLVQEAGGDAQRLYCLANFFATANFLSDTELTSALWKINASMLSYTFNRLGYPEATVAFVTDYLAFDLNEDFREDDIRLTLEETLKTSALALSDVLMCLVNLADALILLRYPSQSAVVLKCLLSLSDDINEISKDNLGLVVSRLGHAYGMLGQAEGQVDLLEEFLNLTPASYTAKSHPSLMEILDSHGFRSSNKATLVGRLAHGLGAVGRHQDALALLGANLGIQPDESPVKIVAHLDHLRVSGWLQQDTLASCVDSLVDAVVFASGRHHDAVAIMEGFLGLSSVDYTTADADLLRQKPAICGLLPHAVTHLMSTLSNLLVHNDRSADAVLLLEAYLGIGDTEYTDRLSARLHEWSETNKVNPDNLASLLRSFANALRFVDRDADAVCLIESFLNLNSDSYSESLVASLDQAVGQQRLNTLTVTNLLNELADSLRVLGRPKDASKLLRARIGPTVDPESLDETIRNALAMGKLTANNGAVYVRSLAHSLRESGQPIRAGLVADAYLSACFERAEREEVAAENIIELFIIWLTCYGHDLTRKPVDMCRRIVRVLRSSVSSRGVELEDRLRFAERLPRLTRALIATGQHWARTAWPDDIRNANDLRKETLVWRAELGQRSLLERFARLEVPQVALSKAKVPIAGWSLLPDSSDTLGEPFTTTGGSPLTAPFAVIEADDACSKQSSATLPVGRFEQAQQISTGQVSEREIAQAVGPGAILLQADFDPDGRLVWNGFRSDGVQLEVVAHDQGKGHRSDKHRLRWAAAIHDIRLAVGWARVRGSDQLRAINRRVLDLSHQLQSLLTSEVEVTGVRVLLRALAGIHRDSGLSNVANVLESAVRPLLIAPSVDLYDSATWLQEAQQGWQAIVHLFCEQKDVVQPTTNDEVRVPLDRATERYLQGVSSVWDLTPLSEFLSEDIHIATDLDDALHAVPVAHLPIGGIPLFRRVCSVNGFLSILLTSLEIQVETEQQLRDSLRDRILTLSHFEPNDPARRGAVALHAGQAQLVDQSEVTWYSASDTPPGERKTLAAGLKQHDGYRAVTICGHGVPGLGVALADGPWKGDGQVLEGIELLIQLSCSIGRVIDSGQRDFEGFCADIMAHRLRSVLACRWFIDSEQGPIFANVVLEQYLRHRSGLVTPDPPCARRLRALALDEARRICSENGSVGLSTSAAFELYGLP